MAAKQTSAALYNFEVQYDVLLARWDDSLSAESAEFLESVVLLFKIVDEKEIKKVLIDSGVPAGGTLTEAVMNYVQSAIVPTNAEKIALLESSDFHWDNNLLQFFQFLKRFQQLDFVVKLFSTKEQALDWLYSKSKL